jgi:tellurite resistance protein TehA-like permease
MTRVAVLPSVLSWFKQKVDTLSPGSFALVMATGIIANAFYTASQQPG